MPRDTAARAGRDGPPQDIAAGQERRDGGRIGIQVEQPPAALDRRGQVPEVLQLKLTVDVAGAG